MRVALASALVVALAVSAYVLDAGASSRVATVTVDLRATRQTVDGFGSSERVWADPHLSNAPVTNVPLSGQAAILDALYRDLGLTRVRPVLDQGVQPKRGADFSFGGKLGDAHVDFVRQAARHGLRTFFPGPVYVEPWITEADVDAYVDWAMAMLRRWRSLGAEPPYYAPQNEPFVNGNFSPGWLKEVVVRLGTRLRREGFRTKLVVPDDVNPEQAYRRAEPILADPEARQYVGAVAFHLYGGEPAEWSRLHALASRYGLPLWMTEWNRKQFGSWPDAFEWAETMHRLLTTGGVSAIDYIWGFFGDWVGGETMIAIRFEDGVYRGFVRTPVYWITGQWSRFVRPGYRRVATSSGGGGIDVTAFIGSRRLVVVALNTAESARQARFVVRGGRQLRGRVAYRTSSADSWRPLRSPAVKRNTFAARLEPRSVTTFVLERR
jgi:O-glycosyl hydrolase